MSDHEKHDTTRHHAPRDTAPGRLRLTWPTFRGSPVGWGILAFPLLLDLVLVGTHLGRGDPVTPFGVVLAIAVFAALAVAITGLVQTIRHPRPGPPVWQGDDPR
jgi:hypothetical protein